MRDNVEYAVTGGAFIHWLLVEKDLNQIFEYRENQILSLFTHPIQKSVELTNTACHQPR